MPFDSGAFNQAMREIYGERIEQLLYPENNAGPLHRIMRDMQPGTYYPIPLIYGVNDAYRQAEKDYSPLAICQLGDIKFDEEYI